MKVLLLGSNGQLGWELTRTCPKNINLTICDYPKIDFCSISSITQCINAARPDCIINAAAYTPVDKAEQEKDLAYRINHLAVLEIAELCKKNTISLIHISTDFVFNGQNFKPYQPNDTPDPESVYGKSKLKGEQAVHKILGDNALIIRTAWLYSSHGNNFVKTMLRLMKEKPSLNVIDEQIGTPTWAHGLARATWTALEKNITGTFHWTDAGVASWYDFAIAIQEEGLKKGLLDKSIPILPVPTLQYPTPAKRPMYSVLDKTSFWQATEIKPVHWQVQLRSMLKELK
ncbi:MAG: dTDP-4-dehydrorhamnose reductase [Deltaproteobacteria bacterium]|uniref:dTDP-4-dehydrorhamnose reductase n=1 Tax=Desulfobacula sp. TaxID=2593537 RepID=UPI0019925305|nr:dTDP-4-dehydrorhamnose reductase [Candidatus Desulfobacula maris]MBL6995756.1 dTDP-4-dehydrorhamnose reductase [Desulfobacula sp.]